MSFDADDHRFGFKKILLSESKPKVKRILSKQTMIPLDKKEATMISTLWRLHLGALAALLVFSHPNAFAEVLQQEYPIADVRTISVSNAAHLTLRQGSAETLFVEATEQGLDRVKVTQRGEHLTLEVKSGRAFFWSWFNRNSEDVHFIVEVRDLERLNVSGAVEVRMEELTTEAFRLDVSGASRVMIAALHTAATRAQASGAS